VGKVPVRQFDLYPLAFDLNYKLRDNNNHHRSSFLPPHQEIWEYIHSIFPPDVDFPSSPMTSTSDDLGPVVSMVISSVGLLKPNLLTPVVTLDMCSF
jgi:hypothetical protein